MTEQQQRSPEQVAYMEAVVSSANSIAELLATAKAVSAEMPGNFFLMALALAVARVLTPDEAKNLMTMIPSARVINQKMDS